MATTLTPTRAAAAADDEEGDEELPTDPRPLVVKFSPVLLLLGLLLESGGDAVMSGKGRKTDPTVDGDENADEDPDVDRFDGVNCWGEASDCDEDDGPGCDCCDSLNTSILFNT